jgi:Putative peptidoglycan binding domain
MRQTLRSTMFVVLTVVWALLIVPLTVYADQIHVLHLKGKAIGATRNIPRVEATGTDEGNCFDVEMIDPKDHTRIGSATRCFTDIQTVEDGFAATETTFLNFHDGVIVARNRTTIQPILDGDGAAEMTHIIGTVPTPSATNLLVEHSTGRYQGMPGSLRLGGVVGLNHFKDNNEITFDEMAMVTFVDMQEQVKQAQKILQETGFYTGAIDGILGPNTKAALHAYQAKHGLPKTGELDEATRKALGV